MLIAIILQSLLSDVLLTAIENNSLVLLFIKINQRRIHRDRLINFIVHEFSESFGSAAMFS